MPIKLSASQVRKYLDCRQSWHYTYREKYETTEPSPELIFGKLWAEWNETGANNFLSCTALPKAWRIVGHETTLAYSAYYRDVKLELLEREKKFDFGIAHGFFDGLARERDGTLWILEQKTTGSKCSLTDPYWNYREQDLQVGLYLLAARELGLNVAGVLYDVTMRLGSRLKKGETDAQFQQRIADRLYHEASKVFVRRKYFRTDAELDDLHAELSLIRDEMANAVTYKNRNACYKGRFRCDFYPVCWEGENLDNKDLYQIRKRR